MQNLYQKTLHNFHTLNSYKIFSVLLFALSATFVYLTFNRCFDNFFLGDECYSILLSHMSLSSMLQETAIDVHPPLYYILLRGLYLIFGDKPIAYHFSSFIPYVIIVVFSCTLIRKEFNLITAFFVVVFVSFSNCGERYILEIRMYSLASMFVLFAFYSLYFILKNNKNFYWCIFVLSSLGAAYTHYYALVSVSFFYITLIIYSFYRKELIKKTFFACIFTVIAYLPWFFYGLLGAFLRTVESWWLSDIPTLDLIILFIFNYFFICIAFILSILSFFILCRKSNTENRIWIFSGILAFIGTIAVAYTLSYTIRPYLQDRYIYPLVPVVFFIFGYCLSKFKYGTIISLLLITVFFSFRVPAYYYSYYYKVSKSFCTSYFLETVKPAQNSKIITDDYHFKWTVLPYYYPNNKALYLTDIVEYLDNSIDNIDSETWLIWTHALSQDEMSKISKKGLTVKEVANYWFATDFRRAYKLTHK